MALELFRLDGRVALVTGATAGLGQTMAVALAGAGADIVSLGRRPGDETGDRVTGLGRRFSHICCDLAAATVTDLQDVITQVLFQMGRLDILVNNAGIIRRGPALEISEADWDEVLQVNLKALFFLSQAAARQMVQQGGGKIINIASMLSFQGGVRVPAYTAAKSGLAGLTHALANEWARHNVNVNAIAPGYMATDNTAALRADAGRNQAILERIPAGRWGVPGDLSGVVIFLASPASDYMHGAIVPVDGGWLSR
ncbi:MAG: 2-dehydro-3-deoxy-D-gluconate 5-dehydrogenase KduD [Chloroflexi bacterium]|nr:2-dehydro-3-deoxy-D-gluconate 5-dehydrogenase KduD [Chloroflexota bacterium]MCI0577766.1 2-dehydro-3-deoxy-D-gluconate 5-dehydrogenase KduD [Chloroflexota bacterium]MCI0643428.1 2-dehydro-3-deoxy-D-gluconate 5-dehydrogenase KduD [Chloroflexota bacterium]MCI0725913.1 2-dehydro-3-deoxy-D-gluconate 5-dehydrogenase KduD [Chloroflexota bacterium]